MKKTYSQLMILSLSSYVLALIISALCFYYRSALYIDPLSNSGVTISSFILLYTISVVPLSLAIFNRLTKKWALMDNKAITLNKYRIAGTIRIILISLAMYLGLCFHIFMKSQSLLFSAGIAAVALIFCIPTKDKINTELNIED